MFVFTCNQRHMKYKNCVTLFSSGEIGWDLNTEVLKW